MKDPKPQTEQTKKLETTELPTSFCIQIAWAPIFSQLKNPNQQARTHERSLQRGLR